jgi:Uma2 family endonuclease
MATVTTPLRVGPTDHGRTMTLDAFEEADFEEGFRYELARGVLEVSEIPGELHAVIVWFLLSAIRDYQRDHPGIIHRAGGGSEYRFLLPVMQSGRHPDVAVTLRNTPRDWRGVRPAVMAFEVVSMGARSRERDYVTKRAEYLAYGLLEYWIVDPWEKMMTVLVRDGDSWREQVFRDDQLAAGLVLPGFTIRVSDLWAEIEADAAETETEDQAP